MFTILMMIHTFLSMMIGVGVVTGDYTRMAIEIVGLLIIGIIMEALYHD